ncbi:ribose-5-phosphate isomerase [Kocuria sp. M1R5S2]|uniref:ribose-5-phosphate isomerase n=1 Tax=Kocuria rhizosphaerae TaxID=3376285 RepID=UPI0037BCD3D5
MRVHIATDHAGLELSQYLVEHLTAAGYDLVDHGPAEYDALDDYPAFCISAARAVRDDREHGLDSLGIVLGGSGNGEQMAANKVRGIRAALAWNLDTARLARGHNDAQVVAVGGRQHPPEEALEIVQAFLAEPFTGEERHARRIAQIAEYESTGTVAGRLDDIRPRQFPAVREA